LFRPDDGSHLSQVTPRMQTGTKAEGIQGFRYPAPGSQPQPKVPLVPNEDQIYDAKFFSRDSRNLPVQVYIYINYYFIL